MATIRLLDVGLVSPLRSQTLYHAVAYALDATTPDTIMLVSSDQPYVCVGFHQEAEKEVDLDYCSEHGLPVLRREVGGGAVYLDSGQVFTQWIFQRRHLPADLGERFRLYVGPLVETYRALGVNATYRPINDIHVEGRKIGGTGAASIGEAEVVVGSLMLDFNFELMARVLKVASEKMRDKIYQSLNEYMTTLTRQLGQPPDRQAVQQRYVEQCTRALGCEIVPGELTERELAVARELDERFASDEWLHQKGGLRQQGVKIHEDVRVVEAAHKAPGGLVRVTARLRHGRIDDLTLSGDFTILPAFGTGALEQALRGMSLDAEACTRRVEEVYRALGLQSPGLTPEAIAQAVLALASPPA
ncbi:MAG: lipoate--protein ligase family protein [Chloroflexi bacterium]|nr:lipoate--protein ligase family protein [Chloroflexota bacterium]